MFFIFSHRVRREHRDIKKQCKSVKSVSEKFVSIRPLGTARGAVLPVLSLPVVSLSNQSKESVVHFSPISN